MEKLTDLDPHIKTELPDDANILDFEEDDPVLTHGPNKNNNHHVNPLQKHFRSPVLSITLPSKCFYYVNNEVEVNVNGEIDIYPMVAGDELVLKNPDALLSGRAIELIIQSCVPQINNVRQMLSIDIDSLLVAIRAATFNNNAEIDAKCPKCATENSFSFDLTNMLNNQKYLNPPYSVVLEPGLEVFIRPYNFAEQTKAVLTAFEQGKKSQALAADAATKDLSLEDEIKIKEEISKAMNIMVAMKFKIMSQAIICIKSGETVVEEKEFIIEFIKNAPKKLIDKLASGFDQLNNLSVANSKQHVLCSNEKCKHQWDVEVDFNPANFFA